MGDATKERSNTSYNLLFLYLPPYCQYKEGETILGVTFKIEKGVYSYQTKNTF
jgi:hypothetical protein